MTKSMTLLFTML